MQLEMLETYVVATRSAENIGDGLRNVNISKVSDCPQLQCLQYGCCDQVAVWSVKACMYTLFVAYPHTAAERD